MNLKYDFYSQCGKSKQPYDESRNFDVAYYRTALWPPAIDEQDDDKYQRNDP